VATTETPKTEELYLPSQSQCMRQIEKVLHSASFRNASMLQQLLQYLAAKALDHGGETLKEYTIGVEAFGRPQDFDPKTDTIVRVQIHRLRQKLKEYYDNDGIHDAVLIEIPKGHYLPIFETAGGGDGNRRDGQHRSDFASRSDAAPAQRSEVDRHDMPAASKDRRTVRSMAGYALIASTGIAIFAAGLWVGSARIRSGAASQTAATGPAPNSSNSSDPVRAFWASYLGNDSSPVIAYPDAVFLLDDFNDLFRFRLGATDFRGAPVDPHVAQQFASNPALVARAGRLYYENSYLGFGELQAVAMLSNLFGQMGLKPVIKPSREVTADDFKQHNVIMLGSPSQNIAVANFSAIGDFSFQNPHARLEQWRGVIVNAHPRPNEAPSYRTERDPNTQVLKADYCLITVQPGIVPGRYIMNLGGLDTTGSEGAALFATSRQGIEELSQMLAAPGKASEKNSFPTFQALLRVRLEKGYDVLGASLVTLHMLALTQAESIDETHPPLQLDEHRGKRGSQP